MKKEVFQNETDLIWVYVLAFTLTSCGHRIGFDFYTSVSSFTRQSYYYGIIKSSMYMGFCTFIFSFTELNSSQFCFSLATSNILQ